MRGLFAIAAILTLGCLPTEADYLQVRDRLQDIDDDGHVSQQYGGADCDDRDGDIHPGAVEACSDTDQDCDGSIDEDALDAETWFADADQDGFGNPGLSWTGCDQPDDYVADDSDCNDADPAANPDAIWYADQDEDGHGSSEYTLAQCDQPTGYVPEAGDCDDTDPLSHPDGVETCDGADNDCDGEVDGDAAVDTELWFRDADGDAYGTPDQSQVSCPPGEGWSLSDADCDDGNAEISPDATELCEDRRDNDCSGGPHGCLPHGVMDLDAVGFPITPPLDYVASGRLKNWAPIAGAASSIGLLIGYSGDEGGVFHIPHWGSSAPSEISLIGDQPRVLKDWETTGGLPSALVVLGDADGQGQDDYVASDANGTSGAGQVFLFLGEDGSKLTPQDAVLTLTGENAKDYLGWSLASGGDVTGDGIADLLVGATGGDGLATDSGMVHAFNVQLRGQQGPEQADLTILGAAEGDQTGSKIAIAGDTDGDGLPDLLVGSPDADGGGVSGSGRASLFLGGRSGQVSILDADVTLETESEHLGLGWGLSAGGDVNGDGYDDALVAAHSYSGHVRSAGAVFVLLGPLSSGAPDDLASGALLGEEDSSWFGYSVSGGHDLDFDDHQDAVVSQVQGARAAFLFLGPLTGSVTASDAYLTIQGSAASGELFEDIELIESLEGDRYPELLLHSDYPVPGGLAVGAIWVLEGTGG